LFTRVRRCARNVHACEIVEHNRRHQQTDVQRIPPAVKEQRCCRQPASAIT
jgi:hypothetical protein